MTYNQKVFYKTSSGENIKPSPSSAEKTRLGNVKVISLLTECIVTVRFQEDKKKVLGNLMSALRLSVNSSTSCRWEGENISKDNPALVKAKQLLDAYYESEKNRVAVAVRSPKKRRAEWEKKARVAGIPISSVKPKSTKAGSKLKANKHKLVSATNQPVTPKRVASVAPSFRKKPG